jgi:outer membrane protein OmpA-like peptidoglycan-associated protein
MPTASATGARATLPDDLALAEALLDEKPSIAGETLMPLPEASQATGAREAVPGRAAGAPDAQGFSDLDDLLARTGPLTTETAPILMPSDLLFDYDSADLRAEAVSSMEKLGELIRRNAGARFLIEGHTDSFGPEDYNLALSQRRAENVKSWLTTFFQIPPASIETVGLGKSRLIAPADGTIDQQQINRRVEIVIREAAPQP